jgi:D-beta-D-heptose 7-phosphate kinase/D-beta-D-heptose 1-phosphate adenosyltransferase
MTRDFWETPEELARALESTRVALTNGCYDVIHAGHVMFLKWFRNELDAAGLRVPLVVAINSDTSVFELKGPGRPVNSVHDRATVLLALYMVDAVVMFEEESPLEAVKIINPIALAKGGDYASVKIVGEDFVLSNGGHVFKGPYLNGYSSTEILNRCKVTSPVGLNLPTVHPYETSKKS